MRKLALFAGALFSIAVFAAPAQAEPQVSFSPEFAEVMKIYQQMTPEQRAEVMEQAKRIQEEIAKMQPEERQRLYSDAAAAVKTIDFDKVDVSKIDTSKQVSLNQVDEMMSNTKKSNLKASQYRSPTAVGNPSKPVVDGGAANKPYIKVKGN